VADIKSRKTRKVKSEKTPTAKTSKVKAAEREKDQDREMEAPAAKRHPVRKPSVAKSSRTRPLSPSAGMGDIAAPLPNAAEEEENLFNLLSGRKRRQIVQDMPVEISAEAESFFAATPGINSGIEYEHVEHTHITSGLHARNIHGVTSSVETAFEPEQFAESAPFAEPVVVTEKFTKAEIKQNLARQAAKEAQDKIDDGNLLAPEYQSFNLEAKKRRSAIATFFIWLLDILIVLGIVALILLYKFPTQSENWLAKIDPRLAGQQQAAQTSGTTAAITTSNANTPVVFRTATTVTALAQAVNSAISSSFSSLNITASSDPSEISSLNLGSDTILYKSAQQNQAQSIVTLLSKQFGIQAQLQEDDTLTEDIVLFLTPTVQNPDLSSDVAIVYNGNGTSGIAKQYCSYLTADKVSSCASANAPAPATGLVVSYKNQVAYATLIRTSQFAKATFQQAPSTQTQDIAVTVGK
jgi:hypothetical protein